MTTRVPSLRHALEPGSWDRAGRAGSSTDLSLSPGPALGEEVTEKIKTREMGGGAARGPSVPSTAHTQDPGVVPTDLRASLSS